MALGWFFISSIFGVFASTVATYDPVRLIKKKTAELKLRDEFRYE